MFSKSAAGQRPISGQLILVEGPVVIIVFDVHYRITEAIEVLMLRFRLL